MLQDPLTLYKLIVLYMLNRVTFPLTTAQVSDFILEKEYTNFLTLQQVINELTDAEMTALMTMPPLGYSTYHPTEAPADTLYGGNYDLD